MARANGRGGAGAISKTVNLPPGYPLEAFRPLFQKADALGLKGCTAFPSRAPLGAVLEGECPLEAPVLPATG